MQIDDVSRMVMSDHRELLAAVRGVEAMVDSASRATGDVARRIDELVALLQAHVADEEASPLYRECPQRYPQLRARLESLEAAHAPLLDELRALVGACDAASQLELDSPLSIRIRTAIASLRAHEAAEAAVLGELQNLLTTH
jgi:hypothetical protein